MCWNRRRRGSTRRSATRGIWRLRSLLHPPRLGERIRRAKFQRIAALGPRPMSASGSRTRAGGDGSPSAFRLEHRPDLCLRTFDDAQDVAPRGFQVRLRRAHAAPVSTASERGSPTAGLQRYLSNRTDNEPLAAAWSSVGLTCGSSRELACFSFRFQARVADALFGLEHPSHRPGSLSQGEADDVPFLRAGLPSAAACPLDRLALSKRAVESRPARDYSETARLRAGQGPSTATHPREAGERAVRRAVARFPLPTSAS